MVNLTIDGKQVQVPEGTTVLRAAEKFGISIPTLCDHPRLKPLGGCRLCLVEVEGMRTLQTSCTLPVSENMVVRTSTPQVTASRNFVLSMLFSERNHFCPYCQVSGGDCELQNSALDLGMTHWPLVPNWQPFAVDASHPFYVMDQNRCILCQRCIRACGDLVGNYTLGLEERGTNSLLVADWGVPLGESSCISCGTCVQVCPTGALISRRSAYQGQESQSEAVLSVCIGCSVGCSIKVFHRDNRVIRIDGDWDGVVNGGLLCSEGRFIPMEEDRERITTPLVRKNGALQPVSWEEAMAVVSGHLKPLGGKSGTGIAALVSTRLPAEAVSLFQEIFVEGLKSDMVTSIEEGFPTGLPARLAEILGGPFEGRLSDLDAADSVLMISDDLSQYHQVAGFFIKRGLPEDRLKLVVVNSVSTGLDIYARARFLAAKQHNLKIIRGLQAALVKLGLNRDSEPAFDADAVLQQAAAVSGAAVEEFLKAAGALGSGSHPVFVFGKDFAGGSDLETLTALVDLAGMVGAVLINVKGRANSQAAAQYGLDRVFDAAGRLAAYIAVGDDHVSERLVARLENVPFLVAQASYESALTEKADVVFPVEIWCEQEGHFLNLEGRLQKASPAVQAPGQVLSNMMVLNSLAIGLGLAPDHSWKERLLRRVSAVTIKEN